MTEPKLTLSPDKKPSRLPYWWLLVGVALAAILVDQITKRYVAAHLELYESWMPIKFIEPIFRFTHVHNTGAAFGIFPEGGSIFLVIAVIVSFMIFFFYGQLPPGALLVRFALGLQLGGAMGNLIDRIRQGYVVDFLHLEYWPVSNVADICIVSGVVLLGFEMLRDEYRQRQAANKTPPSDHARDSSDEEEALLG